MDNKIAIESLSMDLMRVALGYYRGQKKMADRFTIEAMKRLKEINAAELSPRFQKTLTLIFKSLSTPDKNSIAEDTLMYSTLCRNYAQKYLR